MYGLVFYAMADGEMIGAWRNAPDNLKPPDSHPANDDTGPKDMAGGGNQLWVRPRDAAPLGRRAGRRHHACTARPSLGAERGKTGVGTGIRRPWAVFAREDDNPLMLGVVTKRFRELAVAAGLRPVRLHDLRHGAASLMLAAGVDVALVSKRLGHSSIGITADTYSHMLEGVGREAAERVAALVPRNRRDPFGDQPGGIGGPAPVRWRGLIPAGQ